MYPTRLVEMILTFVVNTPLFDTTGAKGNSIRGVLEGEEIRTGFWDCRNDQNALFHFGVKLHPESTINVQLLELATRAPGGQRMKYRCGLGDAVLREVVKSGRMTREEASRFDQVKSEGKIFFKRSNYRVFQERSPPKLAQLYAGQDTIYMDMPQETYESRMDEANYSREFVQDLTRFALEKACTKESVSMVAHFSCEILAMSRSVRL